jgi:signal transduction histidine kinase
VRRKNPISYGRALLNAVWQTPLWALPFAFFFGTLFGGSWQSYKGAYQIALVFSFTIRFALVSLDHGVLMKRKRLALPVEIALITITAVLASYVAAFIVHKTFFPGFLGSPRAIAGTGLYALLFSSLIGGIAYAIHFYHESLARARAVEAIRAELAQSELRALRAQVQPHFLFNTLNSIASLIPSNPAAAEEMTTRLSEVFRHTLSASERETTPLGEELEFAHSYLDIERARFGGRLRVETDVEPGLERVPVPSLLLQPVVENAVRHGISPRAEGGVIRITARRESHALVLSVEDDGVGTSPAVLEEGREKGGRRFGLFALRERLRATGGTLAIERPPAGGTRVVITLPGRSS